MQHSSMEFGSVHNFLDGKTILVTGATGFLAKLLVEKILRVQPNIKKLYLLLRAADSEEATKRLHDEVLSKELFRVLRGMWGADFVSFISQKVLAVGCDVSVENLGIKDTKLREMLLAETDIIVNAAATTNFYERNIVIDEYISNIHLSLKYNSIHIKQSFAIEKFGLLLNYHCWHFKTSFLLKNTFAISARKEICYNKRYQFGQSVIASVFISVLLTNLETFRHWGFVLPDNDTAKYLFSTLVNNVRRVIPQKSKTVSIDLTSSKISNTDCPENLFHRCDFLITMAELIVFSIAESLIAKLASWTYDETSHVLRLYHHLQEVSQTLLLVKAVLLDAEEKQQENYELREWLRQIKHVFFDAENMLDEFECETLRKQIVQAHGSTCFDDKNAENLRMTKMKAKDDDDVGRFNFDPTTIDWTHYVLNIHIPGLVKYAVK
ncbi:fatty acyl-CoA reductase [Vigna unguiculata]|uniref:Fatty acyl-CoA reductase n=1 Tax=Vigna unguiculata TaxID=3917 RepID=A0A4D6LHQ2_VIGUN|nr:fatty acyl-CoA reductase [Vigna unguiculata]